MSEKFLTTPYGRVWYDVRGSGRAGIPLLIAHGGPGIGHDYLESLSELSSERPVIFYDQLGSGRSAAADDPAFWTIDYYISELAALIRELKLEKVHLLGQSWGAFLVCAYWLQLKTPAVKSLILSSPCLSAPRWHEDQCACLKQMPQELQEIILRAEAEHDYASPEYHQAMDIYYHRHVCRMDPWPEVLVRSLDGLNLNQYLYMWGASEFTVTGTLKDEDLSPRLAEINIPVLLTCGEFDEAVPATVADFSRLIPGAVMRVFAGASHLHHLEKPEQFNSELRAFLRQVEKLH
ncbi:MAG: proline iminopeptidase-family hydrolase [Victivallaceae bacterium]|nr:proline iminopeptidase-family hydrolase [Victivallaceae bacterium]